MPNSTIQFEIKGLSGVLQKMKDLPAKVQKKALTKAMRKGANVVKNDARNRAKNFDNPNTPEKVYKEITTRVNSKLGRQNGGVAMSIGVIGGAKRYKDNTRNRRKQRVGAQYEGPGNVYYWRFLEFGTRKMQAQPFMRPALFNNGDAILTAVETELTAQIDKLEI